MNRFTTWLVAALGLLQSIPSFAGNWSSGGGDGRRFYFEEGRVQAVFILQNLLPESFDSSVDPEIREWLLAKRELMAKDLLESPLEWSESAQATCAITQFFKSAPISLSFPTCLGIASKEEAGKLLIHEAVHHTGVGNRPADETFADRVAIAAYAGWESQKLKSIPICEDPENVVASSLIGKWRVNRSITERLTGEKLRKEGATIVFTEDLEVTKVLPPFGGCAVLAGYLEFSTWSPGKKFPFMLVQHLNGNPTILYYKPNPDYFMGWNPESMNVMMAKAEHLKDDILFVGGDFNNQPFTALDRVESK